MEISTSEIYKDFAVLNESPEHMKDLADLYGEEISPFELLQKFSKLLGGIEFKKVHDGADILSAGKNYKVVGEKTKQRIVEGGEISMTNSHGERVWHGAHLDNGGKYDSDGINKKVFSSNRVIFVGEKFSSKDLSFLIAEIQKVNNQFVYSQKDKLGDKIDGALLHFTENLSESYKNQSRDIVRMLNDPIWDTKDSIVHKSKSIWSKRAFFYFCNHLAYNGDTRAFDPKYSKEISKEFESFIKKEGKGKDLPSEMIKVVDKVKDGLKSSQVYNGVFSKEAEEFFISDAGELFDFGDMNDFLEGLKKEIDNIPGLSKQQKNFLKDLTKLPSNIDVNNLKPTVLEITSKLDKSLSDMIGDKYNSSHSKDLRISEDTFLKEMQNKMLEDFEDMMYAIGNADMWRLSDLPETFKDQFGAEKFGRFKNIESSRKEEDKYKQEAEKWFEDNFTKQWDSLKSANIELQILQKKFTDLKRKGNSKELSQTVEELSKVQKEIVLTMRELIFSEQFMAYGNNFISRGVYEGKIQNCYGRANLLYYMMKNFFGLETKVGLVRGHFIPVFQLDNGVQWRLDEYPQEIKTEINGNTQEYEGGFFMLADHDKGYKAMMMDHSGSYAADDKLLTLYFRKRATELIPNHPSFYNNLIVSLDEASIYNSKSNKIVEYYEKLNDGKGTNSIWPFYYNSLFSNDPEAPKRPHKILQYLPSAINELKETIKSGKYSTEDERKKDEDLLGKWLEYLKDINQIIGIPSKE